MFRNRGAVGLLWTSRAYGLIIIKTSTDKKNKNNLTEKCWVKRRANKKKETQLRCVGTRENFTDAQFSILCSQCVYPCGLFLLR